MKKIFSYLGEHPCAVGIIVLFLMIQAGCEILLPQFTANLVDIGVQNGDMEYLKGACIKMVLLSALMMGAACGAGFVAARTGAAIGRDLRGRVFRKVISFSSGEISRFSTASLITRCTNDVQQITMVCIMLLRMVLYAPVIGTAGIVMVVMSRTGMAWIIVLVVAAIIFVVMFLMRLALPKFQAMQKLVDQLNLISREILTGIPVIRAFNRQQEEEKRFESANMNLMKTQLFANRVMSFMMPCMMIIMNGISVLVVWVGSYGVDQGRLQVGDMIAFITYAMMIVMAFMMITMISIMLPRAGVAAGRINEVLGTESAVADPAEPVEIHPDEAAGEIRFEHVSFRYPNAGKDVLHDLTFTAPAHKTTAIIGGTGSGKSTVISLIPRFYDATEGRILIDGVDVRSMRQKDLRDLMGYVPQKGILFSGTVASNLRFADDGISDDVIRMAAETAQAAEFIEAKPEGYNSPVAQNGSNISGGQRQRLAIARAVARQPKIFLFDDSFSALDFRTDAAVRRALGEKTKDATVVIVAQRISTIMHADRIIVLDEGQIVGMGTHSELLESCSQYREIAVSQLSEEELKGGERS